MMVLIGLFAVNVSKADKEAVHVAGSLAPGDVRVFLKDTTYVIDQSYVVGGTLIIEPGTEVLFAPNSRLIDSVGGRIIADGFASTIYTPNPDGENPNDISSPWGGPGGEGYATLDYFLYEGYDPNPGVDLDSTIAVRTVRDLTVNTERFVMDPANPLQYRSKANYVYNVLLNKTKRKIMDFMPVLGDNGKHMLPPYDPDGKYSDPGDEIVLISFEKAIMFTAARLYTEPSSDLKLRINPWKRTNEENVELTPGEILFKGQVDNDFSREYGHIIVMPGARAAFFRNCSFKTFKKDTTVDNDNFFNAASLPELTATQVADMNQKMRLLVNGTGGAITTFSSRTWLINCSFEDNFARHRGGALAIMQSPDGFANPNNYYPMFYRDDKNPQMTNRDASISIINTKTNEVGQVNPQIDLLDERDDLDGGALGVEFYEDYDRQAFDDARLSVLLGRMRNLNFERNRAQLADYGMSWVGDPPVWLPGEIETSPASTGREYGDVAYGGAIYVAGKITNVEDSRNQLEIGFGVNHSINTAGGLLTFPVEDTARFVQNRAYNYQKSDKTFGARGGAIYVGENTSLIVAGKFYQNETNSPFMQDWETLDTDGNPLADADMIRHAGRYSKGGAIYLDNVDGRLQVRSGPYRTDSTLTNDDVYNPTEFIGNKAAAGGAIYVSGVRYRDLPSPVIGGDDNSITARNYGFNIKFQNNYAVVDGGAIYTERNATIYGAGGLESDEIIGYGGFYPVNFENNKAGYSGGAIKFYVPDGTLEAANRVVRVIRAEFIGNEVGNPDYMFPNDRNIIAGGGAIYSVNADLNVVKGVEFRANTVWDGNGGAIALIHPLTSTKRFFVTDIDDVIYDGNGVAYDFVSNNEVFANSVVNPAIHDYPADERMQTRFYDNKIIVDKMLADTVNGTGTTQINHSQEETNASFLGFSFSGNAGYAVGSNGAIVKFIDGDKDSEQNYQNHLITLQDVHFVTDMIGYAVGDAGVIIKTTNGGQTWIEKISNTNKDLNNIAFATDDIAYVCGDQGRLLKTVDAGETWNVLNQTATMENLNSIDFLDEFYGVAVGDQDRVTDEGTIIYTTDGGATWTAENSNTLNALKDVKYRDLNTIVACGKAVVIKTVLPYTNAWTTEFTDLAESFNEIFVDNNRLFVVGDHGTIIKSINVGFQWERKNSGVKYNLYAIDFVDADLGFIGSELGLILKTTDGGDTWVEGVPINTETADVNRFHPMLENIQIPENGIGLGGAIYVLDEVTADRTNRIDSIRLNRVKMQNNEAFSGAAVYSDNYNLRFIFSRSLITGNVAYSNVGFEQNYISGPLYSDGTNSYNHASSDLAGAIIYGEAEGPLPASTAPEAGNSIFGNEARFIVRLPDAPNSKGPLPSDFGVGSGGVDTLRGNYWGRTDANLQMSIENHVPAIIRDLDGDGFYEDTVYHDPVVFQTFFVETEFEGEEYKSKELRDQTFLHYTWNYQINAGNDPRDQGPFESIGRYDYEPVELYNAPGAQDLAGDRSIPEKLLMSGNVYDMLDKGTDIKFLDYSDRNMSPIEDFAVGIPPLLRRYDDPAYPSGTPDATGHTKYVRRWKRNPFIADSIIDQNPDTPYLDIITTLQDEFRPDEDGNFTHPIGYPLYLEARANYEGEVEVANHDPRVLNESVFYVINQTTSDFIRVNMKQVSEEGPRQEVFRARVEIIPDSSYRSTDFTFRRSSEGLLTFGDLLTDLDKNPYNEKFATLPGRKYHENYSHQDDGGPVNRFGGMSNIFSNYAEPQPRMPESNEGYQTFFAGERYGALPVAVGDEIRVISRTVLWREGGNAAWRDGLQFTISQSTFPPDFTHEIVKLQTDTVKRLEPSQYPWERTPLDPNPELVEKVETGFLHRVFLTEGRTYPWVEDMDRNGQQFSDRSILGGQGRDSILTVTSKDDGKFYDPRAFFHDEYFTQLTYRWDVEDNSGLRRWLQADTIWARHDANGMRTDVEREDDALGYVEFRGMPINPFVVPGGEKVTLTIENYPPHHRTVDSLFDLGRDITELGGEEIDTIPQDTIDQFINTYPKYLHAGAYDIPNARYTQQDTIDCGQNYWRSYEFEIFVIDSMPRFINHDEDSVIVQRRIEGYYPDGAIEEDTFVVYAPTVLTCDQTEDNRLRANLTNKLRFQIDINTDDECEDFSNPTKADYNYPGQPAWDFRYGKVAYGFINTAARMDEIVYMDKDTNEFNLDLGNMEDGNEDGLDTLISQTRPIWMSNDEDHQYIMRYDSDEEWDQYGSDFQTMGKLNVRIPSDEAMDLLIPDNRHSEEYNTDTTFAIVVNDGHGGINVKEYEVFINFAPEFVTPGLADAKEDWEYNPQYTGMEQEERQMLDSNGYTNESKRIVVKDPNFNQYHTFRLIYATDFVDDKFEVLRDPCYPEAGNLTVDGIENATPDWLQINRESGLLYGVPGVKDAPRNVKVTVLVRDEDDLPAMKTYDMFVDSTNHTPRIFAATKVKCVDFGEPYEDTLNVTDRDLLRGILGEDDNEDWVEQLTLEIVEPTDANLEIHPEDIITGIKGEGEDTVQIIIRSDSFEPSLRDADGKVTIKVKVTDKAGNEFIFTYRVKLSDPTDFICPVTVANSQGAKQVLEFGTAGTNASTGDGNDGKEVGSLDNVYCEYELPPLPHKDVFDVRWRVPLTNGILRNIFPRATTGVSDSKIYKADIQSGGIDGNTSKYYPVTITWNRHDVPTWEGTTELPNPTGATWAIKDALSFGNVFNYNMNTGEGASNGDCPRTMDDDGNITITINRNSIKSFVIEHVWANDVETPEAGLPMTGISKVTPNPVVNEAMITFGMREAGHVKIDIIDPLGNLVEVVTDAYVSAGSRDIVWRNTDNLASGTYTVRLTSGSVTSTQQMVLVK